MYIVYKIDMAEDCACQRRRIDSYEYKRTSNLVLQADRTLIDWKSRRTCDMTTVATGENQGRALGGAKVGDKHERTKPQTEQTKEKRPRNESPIEEEKQHGKSFTHAKTLHCQPKLTTDSENCQSYEVLLSFISNCIGFQPREILSKVAVEVLKTLTDTQVNEKKEEITALVGKMSDERFHVLVSLVKNITSKKKGLVIKEKGILVDKDPELIS